MVAAGDAVVRSVADGKSPKVDVVLKEPHDENSRSNGFGVVIIGRNEGERLRRCLESVVGSVSAIVYVDSASTDGSVALAESLGATVVDLDTRTRFSAGRARNAGFERLTQIAPDIEFVQFVDGDCVLDSTWWEVALDAFRANPKVAALCGRQREVDPTATIYNRLLDIEWDEPSGLAKWCGGCAMYRVHSFREVGGFDPTVIAGEEPELCVRMRSRGDQILRIDHPMTRHHGDMTRFSQWWMRNVRAGHAFAQARAMHGAPPERHGVRQSRSILFWAFLLPLSIALLAIPTKGWSLVLLVGYLVLFFRVWRHTRRSGRSLGDCWLCAFFTVLGKWPQFYGQTKYSWRSIQKTPPTIIEHK